jgi:hypothetical protein
MRQMRLRTRRDLRAYLVTVLLCSSAVASPALAAKTDTVVLRNGNRITGEVKEMIDGRLSYSTDDMGTLSIEWLKVAELTSPTPFQVRTADARRFIGRIQPLGPGMLIVVGDPMLVAGEAGLYVVTIEEVVRINRLDAGFWKRLEGSFDLGMTYTQADRTTQFNFDFHAEQRRRGQETSIDMSAILTDHEGADSTRRYDATLSHLRWRRSKWFTSWFGGAQGNQELGLDLRAFAGGGGGRIAIQTNRTELRGGAALVAVEEWSTEGETAEEIEAALLGSYSFFTFDYPNTRVDVRLAAYHGLSSEGALRVEGDISVRRELWRDFYVSVSAYESFDQEPFVEGAAQNDWGFTTSIGWSF